MSQKTVTLTDNSTGKTYTLPVLPGTTGPEVIDIRKLYADSGYFTYDPGFTSTVAASPRSPYIDGDEGILLHRGYAIEDLAKNCNFLEVCYLLLHGELPSPEQMVTFDKTITYHTMVHEQINYFLRGFRRDAHPMAVLCGVTGALSSFYHDSTDIEDPTQRMIASHRLIAKLPTIAAMAYKYSVGQPFMYPRNDLELRRKLPVHDVRRAVRAVRGQSGAGRAMDRIFILHADHEQNASTSTVRLAGSSGANPFACIAAGIASLWGPAHGGANEAVLKMLQEIGDKERIPEFIKHAKDKNDSFRLMGFGHRVYKNFDPRAQVMRETCHEVLADLGIKTTRCSTSRWSWSGSLSRTNTSSRRSCTRTSISIRASS